MHCCRWMIVVAAALTAGLASTLCSAERPHIYCITGATIVPAPDERLNEATIVIRDGLIEGVGTDLEAPPDAVTIDGQGLWVYAGFIDPVVVLGEQQTESKPPGGGPTDTAGASRQGTVNGITRIHPERSVTESLEWTSGDLKKKSEKLRGLGYTVVHVVPADGVFRGSSSTVVLLEDAFNEEVVLRNNVAQNIGFDHGTYGSPYPSSLMGVAAAIRQVLLDAERYSLWRKRYGEDPHGMARPEHSAAHEAVADAIDQAQTFFFHAGAKDDILLAARLANEFDLNAVLVGSGAVGELDIELAVAGYDVVLPMAFPKTPDVKTDDDALEQTFQTMHRYLDAAQAGRLLHEAGVSFALTTHGLKDLTTFKKNLRSAIDEGLPEGTALAALTTIPAQMLGIDRVAGTLEPGKIANLAVFDGPAFDESSRATRVFVDGRLIDIEAPPKPKDTTADGGAR